MKLGLGLGLSSVARISDSSPLLNIPGLLSYVDFTDTARYAFSSGVVVDAVTPVKGTIGFTNAETAAMEYDAALFGGLGGIKTVASDSDITYDSNSGAPAAMTIGAVVHLPAHSSNKTILSLGGTGSGSSFARLVHAGEGLVTYGRSEASSFPTVVNIGTTGTVLVIVRYNSAGSADTFGNSVTSTNMDPNNAYQAERVWLGDRGTGSDAATSMGFAEFFQSNEALSDSDIAAIMSHWAARYGVTLS